MVSALRTFLTSLSAVSFLAAVAMMALDFGTAVEVIEPSTLYSDTADRTIPLLPNVRSAARKPRVDLGAAVDPDRGRVVGNRALYVSAVYVPDRTTAILARNEIAPRISRGSSQPTGLRISRLGIDSPVVSSGRTDSWQMALPDDGRAIAWYSEGVTPGEKGVALLAGHRDWAGSAGAFHRLNTLRKGDTVEVDMAGGDRLPFVVWQSELYPASLAPSGEILRRDGPPSIVLVTCEGSFDPLLRDYSHRRVVLAVLSSALERL